MVSLLRVDATAVVDADLSVPQILLTPCTTTRSDFAWVRLPLPEVLVLAFPELGCAWRFSRRLWLLVPGCFPAGLRLLVAAFAAYVVRAGGSARLVGPIVLQRLGRTS